MRAKITKIKSMFRRSRPDRNSLQGLPSQILISSNNHLLFTFFWSVLFFGCGELCISINIGLTKAIKKQKKTCLIITNTLVGVWSCLKESQSECILMWSVRNSPVDLLFFWVSLEKQKTGKFLQLVVNTYFVPVQLFILGEIKENKNCLASLMWPLWSFWPFVEVKQILFYFFPFILAFA